MAYFLFVLVVVVCASKVALGSYLQANYWSDTDSCGGDLTSQAFAPMGKCIQAPATPDGQKPIPFKSATVSCTQNADGSISISGHVYVTSSSCSGIGAPLKETIDAGCQDGGTFACVPDLSSATSVSENWPAIGAYFGDNTCAHADAMLAFKANDCVGINGDQSGSVQINDNDSSYEGKAWEDVTDCSGAPTKEVTIPKDTCQAINTQVGTSTYADALQSFKRVLFKALGSPEGLEKALGRKPQGKGSTVYYYGSTADKVPM